MEPIISKWHQELELFSNLKPLLILEGNVLDQYRYPVPGSIPQDELVSLSRYLHGYFSDQGYDQIVFYSNLIGFMNPYQPEMLQSYAQDNHVEIRNGVIPAEFKGNEYKMKEQLQQ